MNRVQFSTRQFMTYAVNSELSYNLVLGRNLKTWLYADVPNAADFIFCENDRKDGFNGRFQTFNIKGRESRTFQGVWKCSAEMLLIDTGINLTNQYMSQGIVSLGIELDESPIQNHTYYNVLHYDLEPQLGECERIKKIAQNAANKAGAIVYFAVKNCGSAHESYCLPEKNYE